MMLQALRRRLPGSCALAIAPPYLWLLLFFLVPFLLVVKISFSEMRFGIPPYEPLVQLQEEFIAVGLHLRSYAMLFSDSLYVATYLSSLRMAAVTTLLCILI